MQLHAQCGLLGVAVGAASDLEHTTTRAMTYSGLPPSCYKLLTSKFVEIQLQNLSNAYRVEVTFSRPVVDITLREIGGYIRHEDAGHNRYIITGDESTLNEAIFDFAISKNLKILEMSTLRESVENIFQQLTTRAS